MKFLEIFLIVVFCSIFTAVTLWLGMGVGIAACVNHGDKGFQHILYKDTVVFVCEVKK